MDNDSSSQRRQYYWMKISSVVVACLSLLLLETYIFTSLPHSTKYKIYRFQFGIILNIVFFPGSKYIWRRLVEDTLTTLVPSLFSLAWKGSVLLFLTLAHFSPFTNYLMDKEPSFLNLLSWTCFGMYIGIFFVLGSLNIVVTMMHKTFSVKLLSRRRQSILAVGIVAICSLIALDVAHSPPTIISVEVPIAKLPKSMDFLRIALLCDVHLGPTVGYSKLDRVVKMTNEINPDVIVFAGDLMDVTVADSHGSALPLKNLKAPYGKYFTTGNHEYYTGDVDSWIKLLEEYDFTVLHNENKKIHSKTSKDDWFCLVGTDDIQANQISYGDHGMNLTKAYNGCDDDHASILVAHQPKAAKIALDSEFSIQLVLSGHTHGGQIYPIIWFAYVVNPFLKGLHQYDDDSYVYVSQGSVYYGFPLRLGSHPEITEIILRAP